MLNDDGKRWTPFGDVLVAERTLNQNKSLAARGRKWETYASASEEYVSVRSTI